MVVTILEICPNLELRTHIMFKANFSYEQLQKYFKILQEKGLLEMRIGENEEKRYVCTYHGLQTLESMSNLLKAVGSL